ncbi:hypothetical protein OSB04_006928 [Centaurea solstitialis]|uniref:Uncharacterized protein n=1 Tax=Centaurea solstitialis TaxID=347529 RepID=A0AA38TRI4_9ASTR|nr:hypothetical protein OSB04_006928 [Centaurea solstitialis]
MRPIDISNDILGTNDSGLSFKLNLLVLFVNLMVECTSMGSCQLNFLVKLRDEEMIKRIDWCTFIFDKLRASKQHWSRDNRNCFYAGPLTYLMMKDNMQKLMNAKLIAERTLQDAFSKFPAERSFIVFKSQFEELFGRKFTDANDRKGNNERNTVASASSDILVRHPKKEEDPIPIRSIPACLTPICYSPQFIEDIDTSMKKAWDIFAVKKALPFIDPRSPSS